MPADSGKADKVKKVKEVVEETDAEADRKRRKKEWKLEAEKAYKERRDQEIKAVDEDIQRNVAKKILHNRGLTRKRKKIDRNPRVKKRVKYEQTLKKRKNVVKEYKEGKQELYRGETSGIKIGLVRGIAL